MVPREPITIFSCPKPFRGHINTIQRNALRSWMRLSAHVVLLGNEEGVAEAAEEFGAIHIPSVRRSEWGTPLVSDIFAQAERLAEGETMFFTNADMIYTQSAMDGLRHVASRLDRFLVLGQRWDLDVDRELDFEDGGKELDQLVRAHGQKHSPSGMDYWGFPKHLWGPLPDFIIGRAAWDGAMLSRTLHAKIPVVDATNYILAVHQNHDYSHVSGDWQEVWEGPEAQRNKELAEPLPWIIDIWYSTHILEPTGIVSKKKYVPSLPHRSVNDPGIFAGQPGAPIQLQPAARPIQSPAPPPPRPPERRRAARPITTEQRPLEMTIFACPKAFRPPFDLIQRNAIGSWGRLFPSAEIILFGGEEGTAKAASEFSATHIPNVDRSPSGTPLVNSMFALAENQGHGAILGYLNADIIATQSLMDVALRVRGQLDDFLMIGRRWGLDVSAPISFTRADWWRVLRRRVQASGKLGPPDALDYFIFTPGLWKNLPPLAVGRAAMDGALIALALRADRPVVDATGVIFAVHQNHDYSHLPGGKDEAWNGPDAKKNRELVPDWAKTIVHATWKMTAGGLFKKS